MKQLIARLACFLEFHKWENLPSNLPKWAYQPKRCMRCGATYKPGEDVTW